MHVARTSTLSVAVRPLEGTGSLDLRVGWDVEDTESPEIVARLIPVSLPIMDLDFTISGGNSGTFFSNQIPPVS